MQLVTWYILTFCWTVASVFRERWRVTMLDNWVKCAAAPKMLHWHVAQLDHGLWNIHAITSNSKPHFQQIRYMTGAQKTSLAQNTWSVRRSKTFRRTAVTFISPNHGWLCLHYSSSRLLLVVQITTNTRMICWTNSSLSQLRWWISTDHGDISPFWVWNQSTYKSSSPDRNHYSRFILAPGETWSAATLAVCCACLSGSVAGRCTRR